MYTSFFATTGWVLLVEIVFLVFNILFLFFFKVDLAGPTYNSALIRRPKSIAFSNQDKLKPLCYLNWPEKRKSS
ncbi:MAG: hypothetical protein D3925_12010 [Candidatus Electrothrix sp. AR5]|nr:hypothetical protein [Candidatus Electrothrix sp. AR5]